MSDNKQLPQIHSHLSASEVVTGLLLEGKQTYTQYNPDKFAGKYSDIVRDAKTGMTKEDLVAKYGNTLIQSALYAAKSVNGLGTELDWSVILNKHYTSEIVATDLDRMKKYMLNGDDEKAQDLFRRIGETMTGSQRLRSVSADEIKEGYTPFMKSGSAIWDKHIGGFPTMGLIVLAAKTFVGKTTVAISAMDSFMREHPDREILFVTLEDMADGWKERAKTILGDKNKDFWRRVKVMEFASSAGEIIEEASRYANVGMIVVDYVDYMVKNQDLDSYDRIYRELSLGSKSLAVASKFHSMPVLALAQFGKGMYQGGVPTLTALKFTGEQYAYQIVMLYHADGDFYSDNKENSYSLPSDKGRGYLVVWKVKNGCRPHLDEFPGAIQTLWTPKLGFDLNYPDSKWFSLASETKRRK